VERLPFPTQVLGLLGKRQKSIFVSDLITFTQITREIYFVNTSEGRANKTTDKEGIFQKFQWKQKDFLSMKRKSVWFLFCFGEDILQA